MNFHHFDTLFSEKSVSFWYFLEIFLRFTSCTLAPFKKSCFVIRFQRFPIFDSLYISRSHSGSTMLKKVALPESGVAMCWNAYYFICFTSCTHFSKTSAFSKSEFFVLGAFTSGCSCQLSIFSRRERMDLIGSTFRKLREFRKDFGRFSFMYLICIVIHIVTCIRIHGCMAWLWFYLLPSP